MVMINFFEEHKHWAPTVLRMFFGVAFVVAALDKILSFSMMQGMFKGLFGAGLGAPAFYLAIAIELGGGAALLLNKYVRETAVLLAVFMVVAFVMTFKLGATANFVGTLREIMVMNTGGGNTAVNFAYFAAMLSLAFSGGED